MRTVEINIYKFEELSNAVKEKVVNRFRDNNDTPFLKDDLEEELNRLLKENNIEVINNCDFYYSLSHSQGDGVCFVGQFKYKKYRIAVNHKGHYYHYKSVNFEYEYYEPYDKEGNEIVMTYDEHKAISDEFSSIYKDICRKIEKLGYDIIETENSEEHIKEDIKANGYEFYDNGDIYHQDEGKEVNHGYYETRMVESWINSDDVSQNFWLNIARNHYINIGKKNKEVATNRLAETIKKFHEEESPVTAGVYADIINDGLVKVGWHKIAESLIDVIKEECGQLPPP